MHEIYKKNNLPYLTVKLCPNCEELVNVDKDICPNCFYNFSSKEIAKPNGLEDTIKISKEDKKQPDPVVVVPATKPVEEEKPVVEESKPAVFCDCCGATIHDGQMYCGECGTRVGRKICINCKNQINPSLLYCPYCGFKQQMENKAVEQVNQEIKEETKVSDVSTENNNQVVSTNETEATEQVNVDTNQNESNEPVVIEYNSSEKDLINMGRKRLFMSIQMFIALCLLCLLSIMPLVLSADSSFFGSIIDSFNNISKPSVIRGYDVLKTVYSYIMHLINSANPVNTIINKSLYISNSTDGILIFSSIPLLGKYFKENVTFISLVVLYLSSYISLIMCFFGAFIGMFKKSPIKAKTLKYPTIVMLVFTLLTICHPIIDKQETITLYIFVLLFLMWFIYKLVFARECKKYYRVKTARKNGTVMASTFENKKKKNKKSKEEKNV